MDRSRSAFLGRALVVGALLTLGSGCPTPPPPDVLRPPEARKPDEPVPPPVERPIPPERQGDVPEVPPPVKP